ncbi:hypothetical protein PF008_g27667 [Phytophthora fragariae]|nr:hypothetical protein PF008_g27667 [Phytophthora fragariae]
MIRVTQVCSQTTSLGVAGEISREMPSSPRPKRSRFSSEFKSAGELIDKDVIERCNFLMRHAPPSNYLSLKIKGKFVQLIKRLEKVNLRNHRLSRDDCLQPSGVVWKTGEEIEAAGRDDFPEDVMTCTIAKDLFKL